MQTRISTFSLSEQRSVCTEARKEEMQGYQLSPISKGQPNIQFRLSFPYNQEGNVSTICPYHMYIGSYIPYEKIKKFQQI